MPHLTLPAGANHPSATGPPRMLALYYRRALHRSAAWLAVELADGAILLLARRGNVVHARLRGDAAAAFRARLYAAQAADRRERVSTRADRVCAEGGA